MRKHRWPLVGLLLAAVVFFDRGLIFDTRTILADTWVEFYPTLRFNADMWRHGHVPWWNPYLFNGYPCYADPQNQTFYPPNFLFFIFSEMTPRAVYCQLVMHYLLGGLGMYFYAGRYARRRAARLAAAFVYMFNGYMTGHFEHLPAIDTVAWLPWTAAFLERTMDEGVGRWTLAAGASLALMIMAGHPQTAFFCCLILLTLAVARLIAQPAGRRATAACACLIVLGLGLAMSAVTWWPALDFAHFTNRRHALPLDVAAAEPFPLSHLATLVQPDFYGTVWGPTYTGHTDLSISTLYCGLLFLCIVPYLAGRRAMLAAAGFLLTAWLCSGLQGGLFPWVYRLVPGFDLFRQTGMYRCGAAFAAAALTAVGTDRWLDGQCPRLPPVWWSAALCLTSALLWCLAAAVQRRGCAVDLVLLVAASVSFAFVAPRFAGRRSLAVAALALSFADLYLHGAGSLTIGALASHAAAARPTAAITTIGSGTPSSPLTTERLYQLDDVRDHSSFLPYFAFSPFKSLPVGCNAVMVFGLPTVDGYDPLQQTRYLNLCTHFRDAHFERFLQLCAVGYVVGTDGAVQRLPPAAKAWLVHAALSAASGDEALALLSTADFDPRITAVLEDSAPSLSPGSPADRQSITAYTPGHIAIDTDSIGAGFVAVSEAYYPGWQCRIDGGATTPVERANYCFFGAPVPAGRHAVDFDFRPVWSGREAAKF